MAQQGALAWGDDPFEHHVLTERQQDVVCLLIQGQRVPEIALSLNIGLGTARMHIKHLHTRIGTTNLHSLALWCAAHRGCCVHPGDDDDDG